MSNRIQVALLAGFYPAIFFLSNNWHVFSIPQSLVLLIGTSLLSLIMLLLVSYVLDYAFRYLYKYFTFSKDDRQPNIRPTFLNPILTFFAIWLCVYLLRNTLGSINIPRFVLYTVIVGLAVYFTWNTHRKGLKLLILLFIILSSLSIVSTIVNMHIQSRLPIEDWASKNRSVYDKIQFSKKPNIYLIITESYPSRSALNTVYQINNSPFYEKMRSLGLQINHSFFSNYDHTLSSLPSLFGMEHHYGVINLGNFDSLGGRRMLEAKAYNPVIEIFRANKYKIQYLHNVSVLMPNGADVDLCIPNTTILHGLEIFWTTQNITEPTILSRKKYPKPDQIKDKISASILNEDCYFNFIYVNYPNHSPSRLKETSKNIINKKLGEFRNTYYKAIESANQQLIDLLEFIIKKDSNSIIILIGDHGSWGFRLNEDEKGNPITNQLLMLDHFGVLAGIRAPHYLSDLMKNGTIRSHVNLFKYVFAYLSEDDKILETKTTDDSYIAPFIMGIKDNEILEKLTQVKPTLNKAGTN
jgi:hypothetical protein